MTYSNNHSPWLFIRYANDSASAMVRGITKNLLKDEKKMEDSVFAEHDVINIVSTLYNIITVEQCFPTGAPRWIVMGSTRDDITNK